MKCSVSQNFNEVIWEGDLQNGHSQHMISDHHSERVIVSEGIMSSFSRSLVWAQPSAVVTKCHCLFDALHETSLIFSLLVLWKQSSLPHCCYPGRCLHTIPASETPVKDWPLGDSPSKTLCPQNMKYMFCTHARAVPSLVLNSLYS